MNCLRSALFTFAWCDLQKSAWDDESAVYITRRCAKRIALLGNRQVLTFSLVFMPKGGFIHGGDFNRNIFASGGEFEMKCYFKLVKMSYLTESLKIEILMMIGYGDRARTQCEVVRLFRETHPDLPPLNQGTISKIEAQYREMGHVRKVPSKRQAVVDDDTKLNLLLALEENPITPARQLARDSNLNHKTVLKILKYEKKRPYKMQAVQGYFYIKWRDYFYIKWARKSPKLSFLG
ncbi:hypothetical protein NQ318_013728 [Aromia moschata]|uniref:DUF4817 domain-containing protein n=1 Tax=Aromia moschata TaxID=1265417 RepID=A0AAV8Z845_9CUCU|nr:hypothetical protein NQ318_013728 [Aromia moschata]